MEVTLKEIFSRKLEERLPNELYVAMEGKKLIFFLGAGISRIMGIPGWNELATNLIKSAFPNYETYTTILNSITDNKQLISIAYNEFKKENNLKTFYKYFGEALIPSREKSIDDNVYEILKKFDASYLTTNADNLFEIVLGKEFCHVGLDYPLDREHLKLHHLYYLHGHYTESEDHSNDCLVFTAEQYVGRYNEKDFQEFLRKIFHQDNVIVFMGYGLGEYEIIDYIVNKTGNIPNENKVFVLEPFCVNQDIIFDMKKSYFESINIKVIPYNISDKGYSQIIDFLKEWLEITRKEVITPIVDDIRNFCSVYSEENLNEIIGYLKRNHDYSYEQIITNELLKTRDFRWIKGLCDNGLFSNEYLNNKIKSKSWPLLSLLLQWETSLGSEAQNQVVKFLDLLSSKYVKELSIYNSSLSNDILFMILYLDKDHISNKYLKILKKLINLGRLFYFEVDNKNYFDMVITWGDNYVKLFLDIILSYVNFNNYYDNNSYSINGIFKKYNNSITKAASQKNILEITLKYFLSVLEKEASSNKYNIFIHVNNIDNIFKNHKEYWKILINEILFCFEKLNTTDKLKFAKKLILSNKITNIKIGLYLTRKFSLNIKIDFDSDKYYDNETLFHEFYLYLKSQIDNDYLDDKQKLTIYNRIVNATWGVGDDFSMDSDYWKRFIIGRRIDVLSLFENNPIFYVKLLEYQEHGYSAYNTIEYANNVDYVHSYTWESSIPFPIEQFSNSSFEQWGSVYETHFPISNEVEIFDYVQKCAELFLSKNDQDFRIILNSLLKVPFDKLNSLLSHFISKFDNNKLNEDLGNFCIFILETIYLNHKHISDVEKSLINKILIILEKIKNSSKEYTIKLLELLYKWLPIYLNEDNFIYENSKLLDQLINKSDFIKYSLLLDCHIQLKEKYGILITDIQKSILLEILKSEKDKTLAYTLCYNYQTMNYISNQKVESIFNYIFRETEFNIKYLLLAICNSSYLFDELLTLIKENYLHSDIKLSKDNYDTNLLFTFVNFVIGAFNLNKLSKDEFGKAFDDETFVESLLQQLPIKIKDNGYDPEKWLDISWNQIKIRLKTTETVYANKILSFIADIEHPTEKILDILLDAVSYCREDDYFFDLIALKKYFQINYEKANFLLIGIIDKHKFISVDELEDLLLVYKKSSAKIKDGKIIIKKLLHKNIIDVISLENYAKILVES